MWFHKFFQANFIKFTSFSVSRDKFYTQNFSKRCRHKYVHSISRFFFHLIFGGFFDVWPNCAPRMPLKRSRAARGVAAADFKALKTLFESRNPLRFTFYYTSQNVFFVSLTRFFSPFLLLSLTKSALFFFLSLHSLVKCEDYLRNCRPAQKT